ncbi:hypothetical protein MED222_02402 [Vibrio sp. MED222]|nr:hypothetical protein MED222_02402 [Vibrio sp. MED222]
MLVQKVSVFLKLEIKGERYYIQKRPHEAVFIKVSVGFFNYRT